MLLSNKHTVNRLGIYFFYDKDGIVDNYVTVLLQDIKKSLSDLLVVCNGKLTPDGREKIQQITENVIVRENKGFDVWAYKEGMQYFGWDKLAEYDEVILFNFTIMGPLYPFKEMFLEMDQRDIDFWGITAFHGAPFDPFGKIKYGYLPDHIQSHFIAIRNKMLVSYEFKRYWENMVRVTSYEEAVAYHEAIFTKDFNDRGFKWEVYVDTSDLKKHSHAPILMCPLELVKNRKCPIIKRRSFFHSYDDFMKHTTGEQSLEIYDYIKNHLDYDENLIIENVIRTNNQADFKRLLHHNYILPTSMSKENVHRATKIALILHIYYEDQIDYCYEYAKSIIPEADVYITTDTEEKKGRILAVFKNLECVKLEVIIIENRGRDVSALLVGCKEFLLEYDLVCFVHDKKTVQIQPHSVGESFSYRCFENSLYNRDFVKNVIATFDENPKLGLLTPPPPNHAHYYRTIGTEWGDNFDNTKKLAEKLKIKTSISFDREPIAPLGTMFWFRPAALKTLIEYDWEYEDFPKEPNKEDGSLLHAVERIYPFVVQHEGYYPGWVLADNFARIELTNLHYMLREINGAYFNKVGPNHHYSMVTHLKQHSIIQLPFKARSIRMMKKYLPKPVIEVLKRVRYQLKRIL